MNSWPHCVWACGKAEHHGGCTLHRKLLTSQPGAKEK
jgi:hypothetical protein